MGQRKHTDVDTTREPVRLKAPVEHPAAVREHARLFGPGAKVSGPGLRRIDRNPTHTAFEARPRSKDFGKDVNLPREPIRTGTRFTSRVTARKLSR